MGRMSKRQAKQQLADGDGGGEGYGDAELADDSFGDDDDEDWVPR